jgi:hypothetical protein
MFMSREEALPSAECSTAARSGAPTQMPTPSAEGVGTLWRKTTVVEGADGRDEVFSIGPDGMVWSFLAEPDDSGNYKLKNLHMPAERFAVGHDGAGRLVVFAATGMVLRYRCETDPSQPERWTPARRVLLPPVRGAQHIQGVSCETIAKLMLVGVVLTVQNPGQLPTSGMAVSVWEQDGPVFRDAADFSETDPHGQITRFVDNVFTLKKSFLSRPRSNQHKAISSTHP